MTRFQTVSLFARQCGLKQKDLSNVSRLTLGRTFVSSKKTSVQQHCAKHINEIPDGLGLVQNMVYTIRKGGPDNLYDIQREKFEKFGPIFKEKIFGKPVVHVSDAEATAMVAQSEGKFGVRDFVNVEVLKGTVMYDLGGNDYARWKAARSPIAPSFLRPVEIRKFAPGIDAVAHDAVRRLRLRMRDERIESLKEELQSYSTENILLLIYGERMGFYDDPPNPRLLQFLQIARDYSTQAISLGTSVSQLWRYVPTPTYKKFVRTKDKLYNDIATEFAKVMKKKRRKIDSVTAPCLFDKLPDKSGKLNFATELAVVLGNAGVETTSSSLEWFLYHMSLNPEVQENAYNEIVSVMGTASNDRSSKDPHFHSKLPYLNACIKESMRVDHLCLLLARTLTKDTTVCGYTVPSGSNVFLWVPYQGISERYFSRPAEFEPQRWIRGEKREEVHPFAHIPFGFGVRMCLGRRFAELVMAIGAARILQNFRVEYVGKSLVQPIVKSGLTMPCEEVPVKFVERL